MKIDIDKVRADTPGVNHSNHLLACGAALMPKTVADAVIDHINLEMTHGGYEARAMRAAELDRVYHRVAELVGADAREIALVENATAAWCQAFYSLPLQKGDRILTGQAEYAANYVAFLQRSRRDGVQIDVIPDDSSGAIDLGALESMIDGRVALIAITWVPTNGGLVNPAAGVGAIARRHGIPYLLDASQAVGQIPVDVSELGCDFLSTTGRKFLRGPRGTGFLYVSRNRLDSLEPVMIDHFAATLEGRDSYKLRDDARRFENWENAYALRAGLGAAVDYALETGVEAIQQRSWQLANYLRDALDQVPGATIRDIGSEHCAIVSFTMDGLDPGEIVSSLHQDNIIIGTSKPSSTPLDSEVRDLPVVLRAAPHYYNTVQEIDRLIEALQGLR